ncbi:H-NS family nucleoid-associated regulatory protein [Halorhodospira halophila]|uniref:H-NS histone family protein n=1 Tax=Halorhodospira halophila TaxID=1053 RepID=UPI001913C22C|nr:H-NS histone family protein [Halorhodospira halophila]MBK5937273.1 trans-acting regulatory HvrA protein [Halorhodospira halophila]
MAEEEQGSEAEWGFEDPMAVIQQQLQELDFVQLQEAEKVIERVRKQREKDARKQAQKEMKEVAARYGLSLDEIASGLGSGESTGKTKRQVPPKFRHPETGQTWTGRGRRPKWIEAWEEEGGSIEDLRIPEEESAS